MFTHSRSANASPVNIFSPPFCRVASFRLRLSCNAAHAAHTPAGGEHSDEVMRFQATGGWVPDRQAVAYQLIRQLSSLVIVASAQGWSSDSIHRHKALTEGGVTTAFVEGDSFYEAIRTACFLLAKIPMTLLSLHDIGAESV